MTKKHYILLGDLHIGKRNDDQHLMDRQESAIRQLSDYAQQNDIYTIIQLGDWFDTSKPSARAVRHSNNMLKILFNSTIGKMIYIAGNHDLAIRDSNSLCGFAEIYRDHPDITHVTDFYKMDNFTFMAYPTKDILDEFTTMSKNTLKKNKSVLFSHIDIMGFKMNNYVENRDGFDPKLLSKFHRVYSGHYHKPSVQNNIMYVGSLVELDWNDYSDDKQFVVIDDSGIQIDQIITNSDDRQHIKISYDGKSLINMQNMTKISADDPVLANKSIRIYSHHDNASTIKFANLKDKIAKLTDDCKIVSERTVVFNDSDKSDNTEMTPDSLNVDNIVIDYFKEYANGDTVADTADQVHTIFQGYYEKAKSNVKDKPTALNINFNNVDVENFMAFGPKVSVNLDVKDMILMLGSNGAGKTIIIDAIYWCLYGVSYRDVNKKDIINKKIGKATLVKLDLSIGKNHYIITRGIKPDILEVIVDGDPKEFESVNDANKFLKTILVDSKVIRQSILISMEDYIPFLKMKTAMRKAYLEEYFDFEIFNNMLVDVKKDIKSNETKIIGFTSDVARNEQILNNTVEQIQYWEDHIAKGTIEYDQDIQRSQDKIVSSNILIQQLDKDIAAHQEKSASQDNLAQLENSISEYNSLITDTASKNAVANSKLQEFAHQYSFYNNTDVCKTCNQKIDDDLRKKYIDEANDKTFRLNEYKTKNTDVITEINKTTAVIKEQISNMRSSIQHIKDLQSQRLHSSKEINNFESAIESANLKKQNFNSDIEKQIIVIESQASGKKLMIDQFNSSISNLHDQNDILEMVQDVLSAKTKGSFNIKDAILDRWLEFISGNVNMYLEMMNAGYIVKFDANLDLQVTPDNRTYKNLSSGQKQRVDLGLLFVFDKIAKLKNMGVGSNVRFFDEILDSSLDDEGVQGLIAILQNMSTEDTTNFVISHKESTQDLFTKCITVFKDENDFTTYRFNWEN